MIFELITLLVLLMAFLVVIATVGKAFLVKINWSIDSCWQGFVVSYLVGLGIFVNGLIIIGVCGFFNKMVLGTYLGLWVLVAVKNRKQNLIGLLKTVKLDFWFLIISLLLFLNFTACLAPPSAWDEIAYHLPEAKNIALTARVSFPLGVDLFYGSLPAFMEVLYAFGYLFGGTSLIHGLHFLFFVCLLVFLVSFVSEKWGQRVGYLAGCLLFSVSGLVDNSISGYIDGAAVATEVIGFLLLINWLLVKENKYLYLGSLIWGISLGIKYSAIYTIPIYVLLIFGKYLVVARQQRWKIAYLLGICLFLGLFMGGFWYLKNWMLLGNPIFPYFFGHRGMTDESFTVISLAVKSFFVERNLTNLLQVPFLFLAKTNFHIREWILCCLFFASGISWLIKKENNSIRLILVAIIINTAVWFFGVTHQIRFLMSSLILVVIVGSLGINYIYRKSCFVFWVMFVVFWGIFLWRLPDKSAKSILTNLLPVKILENKLVFGLISRRDYLAISMTGFYYVTDYINQNLKDERVINFWNHNAQFYLENGNTYSTVIPANLDRNYYLAVDGEQKKSFVNNHNWSGWYEVRAKFEDDFTQKSELVYRYNNYSLYRIKNTKDK